MVAVFEGRTSDSSYIDRVWHGYNVENYTPICPADTHWNLLFMKRGCTFHISVEGARTSAFTKLETANAEFLVIQFQHGVYLPKFRADMLVNTDVKLDAQSKRFHLECFSWEIPTYDNVEQMIQKLVKADVLCKDPMVIGALENTIPNVSERTIRRRFLQATGMTSQKIQQIERARQAASLVEQGIAILDIVHDLGYADQPHLTRSLKRFIGQTPSQIVGKPQPSYCPNCSRQGLFIDLCYKCSTIE
ncbi:MAG: helix-turn-helix transcriptional regulator [Chloroflexota bacterium]